MSETPLPPRKRREQQRRQALPDEPAQTFEAIRKGQVDAFVVSEAENEQVYVLKSADRLYQLMVEAMGEGAVTLSHGGAMAYCNPHFVRLLGRTRNELLGWPLRDFISEETRAVFDTISKSSSARAEVTLVGQDGEIPVSIAATRLSDPDGSDLCLIVHDLRDQRAREQLRAAKEAAELANRTKDDFLAMVSHELRSPITVILGWTRMLQMNRVDRDTLALAADSIHHSTARLLKLVEDILDASRLSSGKITLQPEVVDLRDAVRSSLESVRFEAEQKPLHVEMRLPEEPVPVVGDSDRLQQVVVNLLANAVKFTPAHGRIDVQLDVRDGAAHLTVRDNGEGIDAAFLPHVFERFRQDDGSTTRAHKGLGLGLAIVKQLIDVHRGSVSAHSDGKGRGATFTVALPLTSERQKTLAILTDTPLPSLDGVRVLLVDDEEDTIDVMRSILRSAGAEVDTATTVAQALEHAVALSPHVIVSDIAMPGEDGFHFLSRLTANVPVLAITGRRGPDDRASILAAGFKQYLQKPVEPAELIIAVHALRSAAANLD